MRLRARRLLRLRHAKLRDGRVGPLRRSVRGSLRRRGFRLRHFRQRRRRSSFRCGRCGRCRLGVHGQGESGCPAWRRLHPRSGQRRGGSAAFRRILAAHWCGPGGHDLRRRRDEIRRLRCGGLRLERHDAGQDRIRRRWGRPCVIGRLRRCLQIRCWLSLMPHGLNRDRRERHGIERARGGHGPGVFPCGLGRKLRQRLRYEVRRGNGYPWLLRRGRWLRRVKGGDTRRRGERWRSRQRERLRHFRSHGQRAGC